MNTLLRNIALWLLNLVRTKLDPDFEKDLAAYEAKVKEYTEKRTALEAEERTQLQAIDALETQVGTLRTEHDSLQQQMLDIETELANIKQRRKEIGESLDDTKKEIDARSDSDAFHTSMFSDASSSGTDKSS